MFSAAVMSDQCRKQFDILLFHIRTKLAIMPLLPTLFSLIFAIFFIICISIC